MSGLMMAFAVIALTASTATALDASQADTFAASWQRACSDAAAAKFGDLIACSERQGSAGTIRTDPRLATLLGTTMCNSLIHQCTAYSQMTPADKGSLASLARIVNCRGLFAKDVDTACGITGRATWTSCQQDSQAQSQVADARKFVDDVKSAQAKLGLTVPGIDGFGQALQSIAVGLAIGSLAAQRGCEARNVDEIVSDYCGIITTDDAVYAVQSRCINFSRRYLRRGVAEVFSGRSVRDIGKVLLREIVGVPDSVLNRI
ncbi:MAG: hypothetical protein WDN25_02300 [Acetobacteraceae bacterium]